jgi:hypothetical protein
MLIDEELPGVPRLGRLPARLGLGYDCAGQSYNPGVLLVPLTHGLSDRQSLSRSLIGLPPWSQPAPTPDNGALLVGVACDVWSRHVVVGSEL